MELQVTTLEGKAAGTVTLDDAVFGLEPRADLIQRMVRYQLLKRMAGTHDVKNRGEVAQTGKKFGRQKGGGGARHGSRRSNIFRGGGRAFGPTPRSHAIDLPKKVRALALKHALSAKAKAGELVILDSAVANEPKTAALKVVFGKLGFANALIIGGAELDTNFALAARNIPHIDVLPAQGINVYDILRREKLVLTKDALAALEGRFQ
jgi:large subunit ribosomal protein L4